MNTKPYVIYNPGEYDKSEDGAGFWSDQDGWVPLSDASRYEVAPGDLLPMGGQTLEIGSMKDYRLTVLETPDDKDPIAFNCFAEDHAHAVEQAMDSYPEGRVLAMNTKLTLFYRDADNYKQVKTVVLQGAITAEQVQFIIDKTFEVGKSHMVDKGVVIAEQIGLPTPAEAMMDIGNEGWPNPDSDHVYTNIVEINEAKTGESFDAKKLAESMWVYEAGEDDDEIDLTVDQLVENLKLIEDWDIDAEMTRQAEIGNYEPSFDDETMD